MTKILLLSPLDSPLNQILAGHEVICTDAKIDLTIDISNPDGFVAPIDAILPTLSQSFLEMYVVKYNEGKQIKEVMVEYELDCPKIGYVNLESDGLTQKKILKINPQDNTITIKSVKDSWNRKEVIKLLDKVIADSDNPNYTTQYDGKHYSKNHIFPLNKWIEENL